MIGLATRAGKTVSGEFSVEKAIRQKRAYLVIISDEASDNTKKMFQNKCAYYDIPIFIYGTKSELGICCGNKERASIAISDEEFSRQIIKLLTGNN